MKKHTDTPDPMTADRLFEAAEAAFSAATRYAAHHDGRYAPPQTLMTTGRTPAELVGFTRHEIAEATAFLARMGFLPGAE